MYERTKVESAVERVRRGESARVVGRDLGLDHSTISRWVRNSNSGGRIGSPQKRFPVDADHPRQCHGSCLETPQRRPERYSYLLGLYLGDGDITLVNKTLRLRISQDRRYPQLADLCAQAMSEVLPSNRPGISFRGGTCIISVYSTHLACIFPQHGKGRKHTRPIELEHWQREIVERHPWGLIAGLLHSDGCRDLNVVNGKEYPRWSFSNRSEDIRSIFFDTATSVGLRPTRSKWVVHISKRIDVHAVDAHVSTKA